MILTGFHKSVSGLRPIVAVGMTAILLLSACDNERKKRVAFNGVYFKSKTKAVDKKKTLSEFYTRINGVSYSFDGAREAGRYEGTKYCINNYGTSNIDWKVGPDTDPSHLVITDDSLTFLGRCDP